MRSFRLAVAACSLIAATAWGQRTLPTFELEHLTFNPAQQAGLLLNTGDLMPEHQFRASVIVHYQHNPLVLLQDDNRLGVVVRNRMTVHAMAAFGITRWLDVSLQVPIVVWQAGDSLSDVRSPESAALGTPWLSARVGFLSQARDQGVDLGLQLGLSFPIGSPLAYTRDSGFGFAPRLGIGRSFGLIRAGLEAGANLRRRSVLSPDAATIGDEVGPIMQLGLNLSTTNEGLRGELNVIGQVPFTRTTAALELLGGIRGPVGPIDLFLMGGPGFGTTPGTPAFRVFAGLSLVVPRKSCQEGNPYQPNDCPDLDIDHDGVVNRADKCVTDVGLVRLSGCPEYDSDNDGITDDQDTCPKVKGLSALAGCPDSDGDGITDGADGCPTEAGPKANKNGCPWPDADGDGELDKDDSCPSEAGPRENRGCPWRDTDGDGLLDKDDVCPNEVGPADRRGCPIKDTDKDTVPDDLDNCPKEKGDPANQGCPKNKKQLVVITRDKLMIKEKVFFDTGKASIKAKSFPLLDQVASILVAHEEIARLIIEGHTDNVGKPEANTALSQKRAEAVRDYLVDKGVAAKRLEPKGFGPDRPSDTNATAAGRENNRRVEFVVGH